MGIKQLQVGKAKVSYLVEGNGPGVLLIHGTGGTNESTWTEVIKALSDRYTVVAPNLVGAGETTDDGGPIKFDDLVELNVQAALNEGLSSFHVTGYSLGAVIATTIAGKYPDRVDSLLPIAGWIESTVPIAFMFDLWGKMLKVDPELFSQLLFLDGFGPRFFENFDQVKPLNDVVADFTTTLAHGTNRQIEMNGQLNIRPWLDKITAPTQVIGLTNDRFIPVGFCKELTAAIKDAQYVEVDSGHFLPWENPTKFVEVINDFISAQS